MMNTAQKDEIAEARSHAAPTLRPTVEGLEKILFKPFELLDHGFVRLVDYMGDDSAVTQAARVSYGRGTRKTSEDAGLINYLMRHWHTTPFEMAEIKLHVKMPIFVARQWIRHRTASVNEASARYSILDKEFYVPEPEQLMAQSKSNKQGRAEALDAHEARQVLDMLRSDAATNYDHYAQMLNETESGERLDPNRSGLARELARINLTLGTYTQWYWKTNLHNLMHFLRLRADAHAQYEIRVYADAILDIVRTWVPLSHAAFVEHRLNATTFSGTAVAALREIVAGTDAASALARLGERERREVAATLGLA